MTNKKIAGEWLSFAEKDFETAVLLYKENHYTDVIAVDIQQAIEKALKAILSTTITSSFIPILKFKMGMITN